MLSVDSARIAFLLSVECMHARGRYCIALGLVPVDLDVVPVVPIVSIDLARLAIYYCSYTYLDLEAATSTS